jgi:hypothetical protein
MKQISLKRVLEMINDGENMDSIYAVDTNHVIDSAYEFRRKFMTLDSINSLKLEELSKPGCVIFDISKDE